MSQSPCLVPHMAKPSLAGDGDVLHPRVLHHRDPLGGIEFRGIEARGELFVFGDRDLVVVHHPFAFGQDAIDAKVDEETEFVVLEPLARFEILRRGLVLGEGNRAEQQRCE